MFPEQKIMNEVKKEQLAKGMNINKINEELLDFATTMANKYCSQLVIMQNKQISKAIKELCILDHWSNLSSIGKRTKLPEGINQLHSLKNKVLNMSIPDVENIFKESYIKENYPELFKRNTKNELAKIPKNES